MNCLKHNFFLLLLLILVISYTNSIYGDQGGIKWFTIETDHFYIHYYEGFQDVAERVAVLSEIVHLHLVPYMKWEPKEKTNIVVTDRSDDANGWAKTIPYNQIYLYIVPPQEFSTLENFEDWLFILILHEYTHILHLDNVSGLAQIINYIFGKSYPPNAIEPTAIIEGFAVYQESKLNHRGRLNSSLYKMYLRMAILENNFPSLDRIFNGYRFWPHGTTPYLFGGFFIKYLTDRYGEELIAKISKEYGSHLIPLDINRTIRKFTGKTYVELYNDWKEVLEKEFTNQKKEILKQGLTNTTILTKDTEYIYSPTFLNNETVIWVENNGHSLQKLVEYNLRTKEKKEHIWIPGSPLLRIAPISGNIYYSRPEYYKRFYDFYDLYKYNIHKKKNERLTIAKRITYFDISPDEKELVYVKTEGGKTSLLINNKGKEKVLFQSKIGEAIYSPSFSPDKNYIVFTWLRNGKKDLYLLDRKTNKLYQITDDYFQVMTPKFSPDNNYIFFSYDKNGIYNIYAFELSTHKLWQITNLISGGFVPSSSPDMKKLVFIGYNSKGYTVELIDLNKAKWKFINELNLKEVVIEELENSFIKEPKKNNRFKYYRYKPWRTLAPRNWLFELYNNYINIFTKVEDAVFLHSGEGNLIINTETGNIDWALGYTYMGLTPDIHIFGSHSVSLKDYYANNTYIDYYEEELSFSLSVSTSVPKYWDSHTFSGSWDFIYYRPLPGWEVEWDPFSVKPRFPRERFTNRFHFKWTFSNTHSTTYAISNEYGFATGIYISYEPSWLGSDSNIFIFKYNFIKYQKIPFTKHNVIYFNLSGGFSWSDGYSRPSFGLGGTPPQNIVESILGRKTPGEGGYLRGYKVNEITGWYYFLINHEYRFPIFEIERGVDTLPIYINRVTSAITIDFGSAWKEKLSYERLKLSFGIVFYNYFTIGYRLPVRFTLGFARGVLNGGKNDFYFSLFIPFI